MKLPKTIYETRKGNTMSAKHFSETITVSTEDAERIVSMLGSPAERVYGEMEFAKARFMDGTDFVVSVFADESDVLPYVDARIERDGQLLAYAEPLYDFFGEHALYDEDGSEYIVEVMRE